MCRGGLVLSAAQAGKNLLVIYEENGVFRSSRI